MNVRKFRGMILLSFTAVLIVLVVFSAQLQVPTVLATPNLASSNNLATLTTNACTPCHSGTSTGGGVSITFPPGMTTTSYTPDGLPHPLTVTVSDTTHTTWGFLLTARLTGNTSMQAGSFTQGTNSQASGLDIKGSGGSNTFTFNWTPPASGSVDLYLTGMAISGTNLSGNGLYTVKYTLMPAAVTPPRRHPLPRRHRLRLPRLPLRL
jgi:hypothetical protein